MKLFLILFVGVLAPKVHGAARAVTHEDIREALFSVVQFIRESIEKLERHEARERQLGEHLRKALSGLDSRERVQDNLIRNMGKVLNSVDERLKSLESAAKNQDEAAKGSYTIDNAPLQTCMTQVETLLNKQTTDELVYNNNKLNTIEESLNSKITQLMSVVEKLQAEMAVAASHIATMSAQYRTQTNPETQLSLQRDWQSSVLKQLDSQSNLLFELQTRPQNAVVQDNTTLEEVLLLRSEIMSKLNEASSLTETKLQEVLYNINNYERSVTNTLKATNDDIVDMSTKVDKKLEDILGDTKAVQKVEQILVQTSDNVMDTKRRIEYGLHQILEEVAEYVKSQGSELNDTVSTKFGGITDTIMQFQSGAVGNLSTKVEMEISQVWRQIGIMHHQITTSAAVLDKLQNETELYIAESDNKLDAMASKLDAIGSDLLQIQDNHNFLIGRLSLFTHEFNETRSALADASKYMRKAFEDGKNKSELERLYVKPEGGTNLDDNKV